jgi:hypothetical protein
MVKIMMLKCEYRKYSYIGENLGGEKGIKNFNKNSPCVKTGIYDKNEGYIMVTNQSE